MALAAATDTMSARCARRCGAPTASMRPQMGHPSQTRRLQFGLPQQPSPARWRRGGGSRCRVATADVQAAQKQVFTSFDDMLQRSEVPLLVDMYAAWCGPCLMMARVLDEVAPSVKGRVQFVKVDTEKYPSIANRYSVNALPTLVLFKKGKPVDRIEGLLDAAQLRSRLEYFLQQN